MEEIAQKIQWIDPEETTVTSVEISSSSTIYGTYSVLDTIEATSDGEAKTSSNNWTITYTDTSGTKSTWYKIRFYDSATTLWSEYSEPVTSEELLRLCTVADVKEIIDTVGRWNDTTIFKMITQVDDLIYIESGTPIQQMWSECLTDSDTNTVFRRYYVGEENVYRVDRVFYGTTTKNELFLDDEYKTNLKRGMIEVLPFASSGVTLENTQDIEVQYVPDIYHKLSLYRTCQALLEQVDTTSGGKVSKELEVMNRKVDMVETLLMNKIGVQLSSDVKYYDSLYGCNRKHVRQSFSKNKYLASTGWDSA